MTAGIPDLVTPPRRVASGVGGLPFAAEPGRVVGLVGGLGGGLTRLGLLLLVEPSRTGMVAVVDVRGWFCPPAAWEVGIPPDRLVVVRCQDPAVWPQVTAALVEGMGATLAEVPAGVPDAALRRLGAITRARRAALVLRPTRGTLPAGLTHVRVSADDVAWEGTDAGHGRLTARRIRLRADGKGMRGMERIVEVDDDGTNVVPVVPGLAPAPAGRAAG
ncbi:MAG: hypothetical protein R3290_01915 [Acidimicrobiia bacterium]|nr:hypothetical protein [Acidimicrobiia bacterium]